MRKMLLFFVFFLFLVFSFLFVFVVYFFVLFCCVFFLLAGRCVCVGFYYYYYYYYHHHHHHHHHHHYYYYYYCCWYCCYCCCCLFVFTVTWLLTCYGCEPSNKQGTSTGPDGAVAVSSANGLVHTGFASRYRLQPRCKNRTLSSLSLTFNRVTTFSPRQLAQLKTGVCAHDRRVL